MYKQENGCNATVNKTAPALVSGGYLAAWPKLHRQVNQSYRWMTNNPIRFGLSGNGSSSARRMDPVVVRRVHVIILW
jgi:hypothetical protein